MESNEFNVIIPSEHYTLMNSRQEGLPAVVVVNDNLWDFEPREVFGWHLSILFQLKELTNNGMPSQEEMDLLRPYEDFLDEKIKGPEDEKPNALFLGTITWNKTRELKYRVFDPEPTNDFLQDICRTNDTPRHLDYEMMHDPKWEKAEFLLKPIRANKTSLTTPDAARPTS